MNVLTNISAHDSGSGWLRDDGELGRPERSLMLAIVDRALRDWPKWLWKELYLTRCGEVQIVGNTARKVSELRHWAFAEEQDWWNLVFISHVIFTDPDGSIELIRKNFRVIEQRRNEQLEKAIYETKRTSKIDPTFGTRPDSKKSLDV